MQHAAESTSDRQPYHYLLFLHKKQANLMLGLCVESILELRPTALHVPILAFA